MTTEMDRLPVQGWTPLPCPLTPASSVYSSVFLALRDMRTANGRDEDSGARVGNDSLIGLCLGMVVLDSLTSESGVGKRWRSLLTSHDVSAEDADVIYAVRNSVLHGYGPPKPEKVRGRRVVFTGNLDACALDTDRADLAMLSVPVFCGSLVERVAAATPESWDMSLVDTNLPLP